MQKITNKKIALIITTFENNIGLKLAALKTYIKHKPDNIDVFFLYGGNVNKKIKNKDKNSNLEWYDIYIDVPDRINTVHRKLYKFFRLHNKFLTKNYEYFIKIDDDTFINNIDNINLEKIKGDYIGVKVEVNEKNEENLRYKLDDARKYKIREKFDGVLPKVFCSGDCVIFSKKAINAIVNYKGDEKRIKHGIEDICTGVILENENFKITPNKIIYHEHPLKETEFYKHYTTHYESVST